MRRQRRVTTQQQQFQLIIFDLDGTLVNSYPAIIKSFNYTMRTFGLRQQPVGVIKRTVGWGDSALLAPFVTKPLLQKALGVYRRHHQYSLLRHVSCMPSAKKLLASLQKKGYVLAIATNRPRRFTHILLKSVGIRHFFSRVLCKDQIHFGKPHPSILNTIMRQCKVTKNQTLYVGDMAIDMQTGRRAGVRTYAVASGSNTFAELRRQRPTYVAKTLKQLYTIL